MLTNRTKYLLAACLSVFLLMLFSAEINAQVEKRVVFAKGKFGASYKGTLPRNYADYDAYVLRARRGQTLSFKLATTDPNAYVAVFETQQELGPEEDMISAGDEQYPRIWSGKLPVTSEYSVHVYGARSFGQTSSRAPYTIEITIR